MTYFTFYYYGTFDDKLHYDIFYDSDDMNDMIMVNMKGFTFKWPAVSLNVF